MKQIGSLVLAVLFGCAAPAVAGSLANCGVADNAAPAWAEGKVMIDPATRLPIRVERPEAGVLIISVADKTVSVRKEFRDGRSITTVRAGGRQVAITVAGDGITISDGSGTHRGAISKPPSVVIAFGELGRLEVIRAGRDLLDRLALQADTVEGNALLLTRALLASSTGDRTSVMQHQQWAQWRVKQPKVVRVRTELGPGECWDKYAAEAIRIMNDYIDCVNSCNWYNLFCEEGCEAIYAVRAEMAFMWYFNCNGPFYGG